MAQRSRSRSLSPATRPSRRRLRESFAQVDPEPLRVIPVLETHHEVRGGWRPMVSHRTQRKRVLADHRQHQHRPSHLRHRLAHRAGPDGDLDVTTRIAIVPLRGRKAIGDQAPPHRRDLRHRLTRRPMTPAPTGPRPAGPVASRGQDRSPDRPRPPAGLGNHLRSPRPTGTARAVIAQPRLAGGSRSTRRWRILAGLPMGPFGRRHPAKRLGRCG